MGARPLAINNQNTSTLTAGKINNRLLVINVSFPPNPKLTAIPNLKLAVYHNPTVNEVKVSMTGVKSNLVRLSLINLKGQLMWTGSYNNQQNSFIKTIDLSSYAAGLYFLKAETNGYTGKQKIVKQ